MNVEHFVAAVVIAFCVLCVDRVIAARKLIVVLADGVRWDYLDDPKLKGFHRIIEGGVKAPYVVPVFPSISYPNWYSIVTGLYAENHGFVSNYMFDNATHTFFGNIQDPNSTEPLWWNEAEPIWITAEKNNMSTAMYWWGGCEVKIKGHHPTICERERFGPPTPEEKEDFIERIDDIIEMFKPSKRFPRDRLSLALFYYGPTDYVGHSYGPSSRQVKEAMYDIDSILDKMQSKLKKAGLHNEVNIIVVSDHGMTDTSAANFIDLDKFATDIKYQVSFGSESMIVPMDGALEKLYKDLKGANFNGLEVYKKEDIPEKYHIKTSKRMTPLYLIANKGYWIKALSDLEKNTVGPAYKFVANHGYNPSEVDDMRTIFLATGPDFEVGSQTEALNITDIYNVMCSVLQIPALPNNGSLDRVKSMLKSRIPQVPKETHSFTSSASRGHTHYFYSMLASAISLMFVMIHFRNV